MSPFIGATNCISKVKFPNSDHNAALEIEIKFQEGTLGNQIEGAESFVEEDSPYSERNTVSSDMETKKLQMQLQEY